MKSKLPIPLLLAASVFALYYAANPEGGGPHDYTLRIASALLDGRLGTTEPPPSWLSEMIPAGSRYYSAFPLGSVLTMVPVALLQRGQLLGAFPGVVLAAGLAAASALFLWAISNKHQGSPRRRLILTLFPVLGTWMWANLAFGGAWHVALGVAVAAQCGALYFVLCRFDPFWAGFFFALAFGNRTEIVLLAPVFYYLLYRRVRTDLGEEPGPPRWSFWPAASAFSLAPLVLGLATLAYNQARFDSPLDFGYARIPGVLEEPWYKHGIFSVHAIPNNAKEMLLTPWRRLPTFPYLVPTGFGGSIFLSSPFLIFLFRGGSKDPALTRLAWTAILALTLVLWCHGNPGGWQFSYRYAMVLLPWIFLILLENSPGTISRFELVLFVVSVAVNGYGAWLFLRTGYVKP